MADRRKTAYDRGISTVDPEARHAHKTREHRQDGFKAHIVIEPDTGIITATALTEAAGEFSSDAAASAGLPGQDTTIGDRRVEVLADSAYGTGDMLAALAAAGHVPVIKPWPLRPAVPSGFTADDFNVDEAGTVTCPNNVTRTITPKRRAVFGAACPVRERCTTAEDGRALHLHPHDGLQRGHRVQALDPGLREIYRTKRPLVERSIAWLTRGARRVPYRSVRKNSAWLALRAAGLNLRRLLNLGLLGSGIPAPA